MKTQQVKSSEVKAGDIMAVVTFVKVTRVSPFTDTLEVNDLDRNTPFNVIGKDLIQNMRSADYYGDITKVTKTQMAEVLSKSYNTPFTVVFEKANGDERKLRGRLIDSEPLMGRVKVEDLDITDGSAMRLVDNRTLKELIVGGVKYTLK